MTRAARNRHREERSDAAIQSPQGALRSLDCFAIARPEGRASFDALSLAMTVASPTKTGER